MRDLLDPPVSSLASPDGRQLGRIALTTALGFAIYGFTVGFWRSPVMGLYVALKMPLLIACTLACNGLLNGLLGLLLGSGLGFRQSLHALLGAFSISGLILGSIAPVTFFLALNAPAPDSPNATSAHAGYLLSHTALIAIGGLTGVLRLGRLLEAHCPTRRVALSTLGAWIAGNAFIGAQLSWVFRPFFGSPSLEVALFRPDALRGSFYETVWASAGRLLLQLDAPSRLLLLGLVVIIAALALHRLLHRKLPTPVQPR